MNAVVVYVVIQVMHLRLITQKTLIYHHVYVWDEECRRDSFTGFLMQWFMYGLVQLSTDFFSKGAGPLLSARGEAIVSRTKDDSFIVEDKATGSREVCELLCLPCGI